MSDCTLDVHLIVHLIVNLNKILSSLNHFDFEIKVTQSNSQKLKVNDCWLTNLQFLKLFVLKDMYR